MKKKDLIIFMPSIEGGGVRKIYLLSLIIYLRKLKIFR